MKNNSYRYTKTHCCIDAAVDNGSTLIFDNILSAKKKADAIRSYYYPVFVFDKRGRLVTNGEYAVPK